MHFERAESQTRPESAEPQWLSAVHPHVPLSRQKAPFAAAAQLSSRCEVHSTQLPVTASSQICGDVQSPSARHCTHLLGSKTVLHLSRGVVVQLASMTHGSERHTPTLPNCSLHVLVAGQPFLPEARLQPGTHVPATPLQIMPDAASPHSLSPSTSVQPQMPASAMQSGFVPAQRAALEAEHSTHAPCSAPLVAQTG